MSTTMPALIVNGDVVGYYPPPLASSIIFNNTSATLSSTNIQDAIVELDNNKFNKSGGTISGNTTIDRQNGTTTTEGESALVLGNNIAVGTDKNSTGAIYVFKGDKYLVLRPNTLNGNKTITLPNETGTLALTSDIYVTSFQQDVPVTANTTYDTSLDFANNNIDTSKILNVTVTWNNPSDDVPAIMIYYSYSGGHKDYINRIQHKWNVSQTVHFAVHVLLKK